MDLALERLTAQLVDYAGTFPPVALAPDAALSEWRTYLAGSEARVLRALCWPATELKHLDAWNGPEFDLTVIGSKSIDGDWDSDRERDAALLTEFVRTVPDTIGVMAYESPLPGDRPLTAALDSLAGFAGVEVYVETTNPQDVAEIADREWASAKFRTAGSDATTLAAFLYECVSVGQPFKLTAGLHAPLTNAEGFGFLNALYATAIAIADDLAPVEIEAILRAEGPTWRSLRPAEAEDARNLFDAIGSCSVREIAGGLR